MTLILASSSPRRRELLTQALFAAKTQKFEIVSPDIDETRLTGESPELYVARMAKEKAEVGFSLSRGFSDPIILAADTIVVCNKKTLGKPANNNEAAEMLNLLSGMTHQVMTGLAVTDGQKTTLKTVVTQVTFCHLSATDIQNYIATGEPYDKAGAYGIQGIAGNFVAEISGSYTSVVGLPLVECRRLLSEFSVL